MKPKKSKNQLKLTLMGVIAIAKGKGKGGYAELAIQSGIYANEIIKYLEENNLLNPEIK